MRKKECTSCSKKEQYNLIEGKPYCFSCGLEVLKKMDNKKSKKTFGADGSCYLDTSFNNLEAPNIILVKAIIRINDNEFTFENISVEELVKATKDLKENTTSRFGGMSF